MCLLFVGFDVYDGGLCTVFDLLNLSYDVRDCCLVFWYTGFEKFLDSSQTSRDVSSFFCDSS